MATTPRPKNKIAPPCRRHGLPRVRAYPRRTAARVAFAPIQGADCRHARRMRPAKLARRGDDPYAFLVHINTMRKIQTP